MRNFLTSLIFVVAIGCGLAVGYGVVTVTGHAYQLASGYVSEFFVPTTFTNSGLGGPLSEELTDQMIEDSGVNQILDNRVFYITNEDKVPRISAASYLVADLKTGTIILSKNPIKLLVLEIAKPAI